MTTPETPAAASQVEHNTNVQDSDDHPEYKRGRRAGFKSGFLLAFFLVVLINSMPFTDVSRFRKAIAECEKTLPRDKVCDVKGVVVETTP